MSYRPPPSAPLAPAPDELELFPVALAYDRVGENGMLVCCRYTGRDYSGRYGNFLGHAVVATNAEMEGLRPIEFWRSSMWNDGEPEDLVPGDVLDPELLAEWLAARDDDGLLAALVDAVGAALRGDHGRIVLIAEDVELIARWIAIVSYSLPLRLAAKLSFVTYTADPDTAPQYIVGTTPDCWVPSAGEVRFRLDQPFIPDPERSAPDRFGSLIAGRWRAADLGGIDEVGELAALAGDLRAAAVLASLCAGDDTVSEEEESAVAALVRTDGDAVPGWVWHGLLPTVPALRLELAVALWESAADPELTNRCAERCVELALAEPDRLDLLPEGLRCPDGMATAFEAAIADATDLRTLAQITTLADRLGGALTAETLTTAAAELAHGIAAPGSPRRTREHPHPDPATGRPGDFTTPDSAQHTTYEQPHPDTTTGQTRGFTAPGPAQHTAYEHPQPNTTTGQGRGFTPPDSARHTARERSQPDTTTGHARDFTSPDSAPHTPRERPLPDTTTEPTGDFTAPGSARYAPRERPQPDTITEQTGDVAVPGSAPHAAFEYPHPDTTTGQARDATAPGSGRHTPRERPQSDPAAGQARDFTASGPTRHTAPDHLQPDTTGQGRDATPPGSARHTPRDRPQPDPATGQTRDFTGSGPARHAPRDHPQADTTAGQAGDFTAPGSGRYTAREDPQPDTTAGHGRDATPPSSARHTPRERPQPDPAPGQTRDFTGSSPARHTPREDPQPDTTTGQSRDATAPGSGRHKPRERPQPDRATGQTHDFTGPGPARHAPREDPQPDTPAGQGRDATPPSSAQYTAREDPQPGTTAGHGRDATPPSSARHTPRDRPQPDPATGQTRDFTGSSPARHTASDHPQHDTTAGQAGDFTASGSGQHTARERPQSDPTAGQRRDAAAPGSGRHAARGRPQSDNTAGQGRDAATSGSGRHTARERPQSDTDTGQGRDFAAPDSARHSARERSQPDTTAGRARDFGASDRTRGVGRERPQADIAAALGIVPARWREVFSAGVIDGLVEADRLEDLWDSAPRPGECARLIRRLRPDQHVATHRVVRAAFGTVPGEDAETIGLAELVVGTPSFSGTESEAAAELILDHDRALRATEPVQVARLLASIVAGIGVVGEIGTRGFSSVCAELSRRGPKAQADVAAAAEPPIRRRLVGDWLGRGERADLAELAVRLRWSGATDALLDDWARELAGKRFGRRHLQATLAERDPRLAEGWRELAEDRRRGDG